MCAPLQGPAVTVLFRLTDGGRAPLAEPEPSMNCPLEWSQYGVRNADSRKRRWSDGDGYCARGACPPHAVVLPVAAPAKPHPRGQAAV